jgi:peptide/nickel transport system substrate-binding protein
VVDEHTVVLLNKEIDPDFLFLMGQATAVIVEPKSADTNTTKPVGTGPYKLDNWVKGSSITLSKWDGYRNAQPQDQACHLPLHQPTRPPRWPPAGRRRGRLPARHAAQRAAVQDQPQVPGHGGGSRAKTILANNKRASRWTTCACAAPSTWPSTARP